MHRKIGFMAICACLLNAGAQAQDRFADQLSRAVSEGSIKLDMRYRFENVDDDAFDKDADASTLRTRITVQSGMVGAFSALAEFDNVSEIGDDNYNSSANGNTDRPVVADPKGTDVNQAWLRYGDEDAYGAYGRQRILHGNQRFVGGVAWRQNEQTYDGFRLFYEGSSGITVDYAYVYNVNRIFGPDDSAVQPADLHGENHLARAEYRFAGDHTLSGFIYALDVDEDTNYAPGKTVGNSSNTYGIEYDVKLGPVVAKAAYAKQSDAGDSPLNYDADYYMVEGGISFASIDLKVGYEVLGSDNNVGFKTPYATLHLFQGWADKFLVTPDDGIEDFYLGAKGALGAVKLGAYYHDFSAEDSNEDFGTEWNLVGTLPINEQFTTALHYANFSSDSDRYSDAQKVWFTLQLKL
tara:strand:- start:181531 stop:182757 length:1227 start_codon:yes stop_codon:yes gene_type:complete